MDNNKKLNAIFDECIENLLSGQLTVEQCLLRYPEYANDLEPMLRTAALMQKAVDRKPSAEFRAKARYQMQLKMGESKSRVPGRSARFVPRWAIAACTMMLLFVLGGSTVLASADAMPGNALYSVKIGVENLQVNLTRSPERKIELYVNMANERVDEIAWMANNDKTQNMAAAADRLASYYNSIGTLSGTTHAATASMSTGNAAGQIYNQNSIPVTTDTVPLAALSNTTTVAATTVTGGTDKNATVTPTTAPATVVTTIVVSQPPATTTLAPIVITSPVSFGSTNFNWPNSSVSNSANSSKLMNILVYNANSQPDKLQQLIDSPNVPESVKILLRRALAASLAGYSNAINNLGH